jgi:hypothetical protein
MQRPVRGRAPATVLVADPRRLPDDLLDRFHAGDRTHGHHAELTEHVQVAVDRRLVDGCVGILDPT